ncbi:hypothetical protein [Facklamia sp. 7083-14-GEN3]|uniref:hypothetical protein n=1 Tax=Facklamia sp. 7083-14-GEN3 TaxID=2973478 RepID=UPI00215B812F|nr:hypothetical protein [Facklamia sp. 7083-14-GEN3]MCR8969265.1 hypothetical protein [Facklamia sp. 7083-14-GEN3]
MKLKNLYEIYNATRILLNEKLDTRIAFKIIKFRTRIGDELQVVISAIEKFKADNQEEADLENLVLAEQEKLLDQESDIDLIEISLDELPKEIDGYLLAMLEPLIKEGENDI